MFVLWFCNANAQNSLEKKTKTGELDSISFITSFPSMLDNDLIFYGFIHGTEMTQKVDTKLLIELMDNGVKYYAPEVSFSGAFFLNKYLSTGEENYLNYVLQSYAAPQDASIQWIDKYRNIYNYNKTLEEEKRLVIIGTDSERSIRLKITHLAHLLSDNESGIPIIDSLKFYKTLEKDLHFISGKHLFKLASKNSCSYKDILYTNDSQYHFAKRFIKYYENNTEYVLSFFENHKENVKELMRVENKNRETVITDNFSKRVIPLIKNGEKVYSNYGYAHILQESFNNNIYLAGRLKKNYPNVKIFSILTHLAECSVLKGPNFCVDKKIKRYGKTIKLANICGAINTDDWDGDTKKEKILGLDELNVITSNEELTLLLISNLSESQSKERYYIDYVKGKNADKIKLDKTKSTSDYYQALIYIEGSKPNIPYELKNN